MAHRSIGFALIMFLVAVFWTSSTAQTDCTNTIINMSPCLNYITGDSSKPAPGCCTQLSSVVRSKPGCLCQVLNDGGSSFGIQVNQIQARALPAACNVQAPSLRSCNTTSPTGSPASNSPTNATPSGNRSNTTLSAGSGSSDGSSTQMTAPLLVFLLFVASYASTLTI